MADPITDKQLADLREQLSNVQGDKDRLRIVKRVATEHTFTCAQVKELVACQHFGDAQVQTAVLLYAQVSDKSAFKDVVVGAYQFAEDKEQVCKALGL